MTVVQAQIAKSEFLTAVAAAISKASESDLEDETIKALLEAIAEDFDVCESAS